jgi:hypothetical protein
MKSCSVELVYFSSCPNVGFARENIREALVEVGRDDRWSEWDQEGTGTPARYKAFSSPTVLVNGQERYGCIGNGFRSLVPGRRCTFS